MKQGIIILSLIGGILGLFGGACNFTGSACVAGTNKALNKHSNSKQSIEEIEKSEKEMQDIAMKGVVGGFFSLIAIIAGPLSTKFQSKRISFIFALIIIISGIVNISSLNIISGLIIFAAGLLACVNVFLKKS
ncbi:putative lipoprotein [Leptospira wolbachii serovar Codice str. CDC]|uniref:Lipoprotein n=1 Tax=Leptospira wolbachii serovar Codice str. CDC TaxID=1218599 RepID=R8ZXY4_9LEPT|nr:hypothetical protein [Leptospira wolbachii]EOQ94793.1 putative lipoprotein [Leptospira wolbachii serovar Codice str. CDC]